MEIRQISAENAADLHLPNEPFLMPGKFIPELRDGIWNYRIENYPSVKTDVFPNENYDFAEMNANGILFGAYEKGQCIGLAIFRDHWLKYMYLYDLKVNASARGRGVGAALIAAGLEAAKMRGYRGIYTHAQDNNLNACLFYLKTGFRIGGFDNRTYGGTSQAGKADITFYLDAE